MSSACGIQLKILISYRCSIRKFLFVTIDQNFPALPRAEIQSPWEVSIRVWKHSSMDPDMIRPGRSKPCPPPPTPLKKEAPRPHRENVVEACQHDSCNFREDPLPPPISPSLWPCHQPPRPPSHVRNYYWNDNLDRFSRMKSLDLSYRMNFRDPLNEDHTLHPPGPPPMGMGHHRGQPPPLLGHHGEPPTSYFPPSNG